MQPSELYIKGGKKAVLLLHAYTGSPNDVRMLARSLEKANYTVLAPLFSGHGTNDPMNILNVSPEAWLQDAERALNILQDDGYTDIAVFGLSLGGIYAMTLIEKYPDALIGGGVFCSPLNPNITNKIYPNFLKYCEFMYKKTTDSNDELERKLNMVKEPLKNQLTRILETSQEAYENIGKINKPIFLAQAAKDEMIDADGVYDLGRALNKTYHEIHWYPNSTHVITVSRDRHLFEADVQAFLSHIM